MPRSPIAFAGRRDPKHSLTYRYRWSEGVPLRESQDSLAVNWLGGSITDAKGKTTYDWNTQLWVWYMTWRRVKS